MLYLYKKILFNLTTDIQSIMFKLYQACDPFYRELYGAFEDPKGEGRKGVPVYSDATYQKAHKSRDTEINKALFYSPYGRHIVKLMTICTAEPKEKMERPAIRRLAKGSSKYFPILICDAGYQTFGNITRNEENFKDIRQVFFFFLGILLGTK